MLEQTRSSSLWTWAENTDKHAGQRRALTRAVRIRRSPLAAIAIAMSFRDWVFVRVVLAARVVPVAAVEHGMVAAPSSACSLILRDATAEHSTV